MSKKSANANTANHQPQQHQGQVDQGKSQLVQTTTQDEDERQVNEDRVVVAKGEWI